MRLIILSANNYVFGRSSYLVAALCVLWAFVVSNPAQDYKPVRAGIEHAQVTRDVGGVPVKINLLRLDLRKVRLDVVHAMDAAIGTETTSSIAARRGAVAAVNAGYFRLDATPFAGDAAGMLMIDGSWLSEPSKDRIQLLINNKPAVTEVEMATTKLSEVVQMGREKFPVTGINRERKADDLVIYTPEFGRSTQTSNEGIELVVVKGVITSVLNGVGNAVIPPKGLVISASGTYREDIASLARSSSTVTMVRKWEGLPPRFVRDRTRLDVVAGVPRLIRAGRIDITWEQERTNRTFVETRHPRTAVAKLRDGKLLLITVDGKSESSGGISLNDLAAYLLELGAVDAMNLDGGGSTSMYVDGKLVNDPSDAGVERKVSDALLVFPRSKAPQGAKRRR
jgi:hypothetical protein